MEIRPKFNDGEQIWFSANGKFFIGTIQFAETWTKYDGWNYVVEYTDVDGEKQCWCANESDMYRSKSEVMEKAFMSEDTLDPEVSMALPSDEDTVILGDVDPDIETAATKPAKRRKKTTTA